MHFHPIVGWILIFFALFGVIFWIGVALFAWLNWDLNRRPITRGEAQQIVALAESNAVFTRETFSPLLERPHSDLSLN